MTEDTHSLSDSDLAVVTALQESPRASWAAIGRQIGTSAATARRRWQAIERSGAAWITTHPGFNTGLLCGLVEVRVRPGCIRLVAEKLRRNPKIITVAGMTGNRDLTLTILAEDMDEFRQLLETQISGYDEVTAARSTVVTRMFSDGSRWRALTGHRGSVQPGTGSSGSGLPGSSSFGTAKPAQSQAAKPTRDQCHAVLRVLELDGRAGAVELASALKSSEGYARRIVNDLLATGLIRQRVDVSLAQRMWPHALALWMVVPAARLEQIAADIASRPMTRMCAALAGGVANLYVIVWLRDLSEAAAVEADIAHSLELRVQDRAILLHYYKRLGHLFDESSRRTQCLSWLAQPPRSEQAAP